MIVQSEKQNRENEMAIVNDTHVSGGYKSSSEKIEILKDQLQDLLEWYLDENGEINLFVNCKSVEKKVSKLLDIFVNKNYIKGHVAKARLNVRENKMDLTVRIKLDMGNRFQNIELTVG